jgi:hypothetical protein
MPPAGAHFQRRGSTGEDGRYPIWALPGRLKRLRHSVDLTIVRVSPLNAHLFPETDYLHTPEWIASWLPLPEDPKIALRFSKNLRGGDLEAAIGTLTSGSDSVPVADMTTSHPLMSIY